MREYLGTTKAVIAGAAVETMIWQTRAKEKAAIATSRVMGIFKGHMAGFAATNAIIGLFVFAVLAVVLYLFMGSMQPVLQTANTAIQAETATDAGTTTSKTFFTLGMWVIIAVVFIALIIIGFRHVSGSKG